MDGSRALGSKKKTPKHRLHCDTHCDGAPLLPHGRVATIVMYCNVRVCKLNWIFCAACGFFFSLMLTKIPQPTNQTHCNQQEPSRGGATAFPGIDLVVQGRRGQALLFHYAGDAEAAPADSSGWRAGGVVDSGFTYHMGCPVLDTTNAKLIVTQWMRAGVSPEEPWHHYASTGTLQ